MWAMMGRVPAGRGMRLGERGGGLVLLSKPAVQILSAEELPRVLPWSGSGPRLIKEVGGMEACSIRVAVSLVASSLVYSTSIEAASIAAFFWAWAPVYRTALPNILLRLRYRYAGVWNARVVQVQLTTSQSPSVAKKEGLAARVFERLPKIPPTLKLLIGDGSSATFEMEVRITDEVPQVQAGELVDVLVVSDKPSLSRFKALCDVYFPDRQLWISEEPCIERQSFEQLQGSWKCPSREPDRQGGARRRYSNLYLEENTLSKDPVKLEDSVTSGIQLSRLRKLDYVIDLQEEKKDSRQVRLEDSVTSGIQLSRSRELDYVMDLQEEKKEGRPVKELEDDSLYL